MDEEGYIFGDVVGAGLCHADGVIAMSTRGLHVLINRNHGISSAYNMTWYGTGYTYITNMTEYDSMSTGRKENLRDMHTFAEITGYNSMMSGMLVVIMLAIQVIVFVFAIGRDRNR